MDTNPYRSKHKLRHWGIAHDETYTVPKIVKKKQRKLTLRHIHGRKTWMADFMVIDGINILNFIHCNSRYWLAQIVPNQSADNAADLLMFLVEAQPFTPYEYPLIDTLITDDAQALHKSRIITGICRNSHIKPIVYNMLHEPHSYLAIIDRISRTLRDFCFNCKRKDPDWELNDDTLTEILSIYNSTPHDTLSKTMGFDVSPEQALIHRHLQDEIVRHWTKENYNLINSFEFTSIKPGMIVYLERDKRFNDKRRNTVEDKPYRVLRCRNGGFIIQVVDESEPPRRVQRKDFVIGTLPTQ